MTKWGEVFVEEDIQVLCYSPERFNRMLYKIREDPSKAAECDVSLFAEPSPRASPQRS